MKSRFWMVGWLLNKYQNISKNKLVYYILLKKHTLYVILLCRWLIGEEVNFGDCRGEIGLRRPILLYSLVEVKSSEKFKI